MSLFDSTEAPLYVKLGHAAEVMTAWRRRTTNPELMADLYARGIVRDDKAFKYFILNKILKKKRIDAFVQTGVMPETGDEPCTARLIHGDCIEVMAELASEGLRVDFAFADPPYGIMKDVDLDEWKRFDDDAADKCAEWDGEALDIDSMFAGVASIARRKAYLALFCAPPYTYALGVRPSISTFTRSCRYVMIKNRASSGLRSKQGPLFYTEDILTWIQNDSSLPAVERTFNLSSGRLSRSNVLYAEFKGGEQKHHPTQKPLNVLIELIDTYTRPGDTVLDFTMGSGSTGVAALSIGRNFIGIEKDAKFYDTAMARIAAIDDQPRLI